MGLGHKLLQYYKPVFPSYKYKQWNNEKIIKREREMMMKIHAKDETITK